MNEQTIRITKLELILQVFIDLDKHYASSKSLTEYMAFAHQSLGQLMYAKNLYLVLYDPLETSISFAYNTDEHEQAIDPERKFLLASPEQSPLAWVITHQEKLLMSKLLPSTLPDKPAVWGCGNEIQHWLGMPLISHKKGCLGALVVQSYNKEIGYSQEQQNIFKLFSSVMTIVLGKHTDEKQAEGSITERTNILEKELIEKKHGEKLQHALFEIASLKNSDIELTQLYKELHQIIDKLLYAKNFYILLFNEESNEITFPYFVDEKDGNKALDETISLGEGMSSYVIKTRKPQRLTSASVDSLIKQGKIKEVLGDKNFTSWLGAPMISANILHGVIVIQSYDAKIVYTDNDLNILNFVANHVASAIEATINTQERRQSQIKLAKHHRLLEQQNLQLNHALKELKATQQELIQKEKMASLGGLVAGIAHEINTPLGICVTVSSHLKEESKIFRQSLTEQQAQSFTELPNFLDDIDEIVQILMTNTQRATDLIHSFKQIAVDQSSNEIRQFNIKNYLDEIILSLRPKLKRTKHIIEINCQQNIWLTSHAGALAQVMSNLILNSIKHGFEGMEQGTISIDIVESNKSVLLTFHDNGCGLNKVDMNQLFDPFFTTMRGHGGSGLGTHLIYNLVISSLKGKLQARSEPGQGLTYNIKFPKKIDVSPT